MPIKSLHLQFRFLLPLLLVLALVGGLGLPVVERWTTAWFARDLQARGAVLAKAVSDAVETALQDGSGRKLDVLLARTVRDQQLVAVGWCSAAGELVSHTRKFPSQLTCRPLSAARGEATQFRVDGRAVHVSAHDAGPLGQMLVVQGLGPAEHRSEVARRSLIALIAGLGLVTALVTSVVAQLTLRRWVRATRSLLRGDRSKGKGPSDAPELEPVAAELHARLRDLEDDCRRSRVPGLEWDAQRLQLLLRAELSGDEVIVVSNREPYVHERLPGGGVRVLRPASGLVTAVEPIVRACSGTWIAHGSGSADRDTVDHADRVALPPGGNDYHLRRVWLSPEQEQGYYSGFSNEGLWPLCHVAHVRPVFRDADWQHYREVNQRFADAVVAEARSEDPVILVQDYHLALLPAMVRRKLPRATILTFWHIPWPNPESFGICPWRKELLEGLLGSTILGFHTPTHCMNFLETADRHLEARIEHEHSAISLRGEQTFVQSYPISIAWPSAETSEAWAPPDECRRRLMEGLQIPAHHRLAVGVDRLDYTKGILERLHAVERLLEKHPQWRDRFTFVQIAAPTRSSLEEYQAFRQRIDALARRINQRFGGEHEVVRLLMEHHESDALTTLYRAADACLVTSLHDGMNLVCKEFIAARDDEQGVLVLSSFAGAARDLPEALVVNPYHVEEVADAIHRALTMPELEQRERMADLRSTVRESNVFRWAGWMLGDAARLRRRERSSLRVQRHGQRRVGVVRH